MRTNNFNWKDTYFRKRSLEKNRNFRTVWEKETIFRANFTS